MGFVPGRLTVCRQNITRDCVDVTDLKTDVEDGVDLVPSRSAASQERVDCVGVVVDGGNDVFGVVDALRVIGSSGIDVTWASLGMQAPGGAREFRSLFGRSDETFRRLDCASRALVLAGGAAGLTGTLAAMASQITWPLGSFNAICIKRSKAGRMSCAASHAVIQCKHVESPAC